MIQRDLSDRQIKVQKLREEFTRKMRAEGFSEEEIAELFLTNKEAK